MSPDATKQLERRLEKIGREAVASLIERTRQSNDPLPPDGDRRACATAAIRHALHRFVYEHADGDVQLSPDQQDALVSQVLKTMFSVLARIDQHLSIPGAIELQVNGWDNVWLVFADGRSEQVEPFATSDDEVAAMAQDFARRNGIFEKEFHASSPILDVIVPDGSRVAAMGWLGGRVYAVFRRPAPLDVDLEVLREWGMFDAGVHSLLRAIASSRANVLISGEPASGKTTLLRALAHECDPTERLVVVEDEPELRLDACPDRHRNVVVALQRPGNVEGIGAVSMRDLTRAMKRFSPNRIIVGETRGEELLYMLEAMTQGVRGCMSTMHADSALSVFPRMGTYVRSWDTAKLLELAAVALDYVIHVRILPDAARRVVAEVVHVEGFDHLTGQVITSAWLVPGPDGSAARNPRAPIPADELAKLISFGYDPASHHAPHEFSGSWR